MDIVKISDYKVDEEINEVNLYISELVLNEIDNVSKQKTEVYNKNKQKLKDLQNKFEPLKKQADLLIKGLSKEKQLSRVLYLIDTLKKEGKLIGKTKISVKEMLLKIDDYNYEKLTNIEQKLSIYLPDKYIKKTRSD